MCRAIHAGGRRCPGGSGHATALARAERAAKVAAKREARARNTLRYKEAQMRQADEARAFIDVTRGLALTERHAALEQHLGRLGKGEGSHRAERAVLSAEMAHVQGLIDAEKRAEFLRAMGIDPTLDDADVTRAVYHRAGLKPPSEEALAAVYTIPVQGDGGQGTRSSDGVPLPQFDAPPVRIEKPKPKRRTKALDKAEERLADLERMGASPESIAVARRRVEALTPEPGQPAPKLPSKPLAKARKAVADAVAAGADQGTVDALQRRADKLKPAKHPVIEDPAAPLAAQVPSTPQPAPAPSPWDALKAQVPGTPQRVTPSVAPSTVASPNPWDALRAQVPGGAQPAPSSAQPINVAGQGTVPSGAGTTVPTPTVPAPAPLPPRTSTNPVPGASVARTRARVYADGTVVANPEELATIDDAHGFASREQAARDEAEYSPRREVNEALLPAAESQVQAVIASERAKGTTDGELRIMLSDAVLSMKRSDNPEMHEALLGAMRSLEWR